MRPVIGTNYCSTFVLIVRIHYVCYCIQYVAPERFFGQGSVNREFKWDIASDNGSAHPTIVCVWLEGYVQLGCKKYRMLHKKPEPADLMHEIGSINCATKSGVKGLAHTQPTSYLSTILSHYDRQSDKLRPIPKVCDTPLLYMCKSPTHSVQLRITKDASALPLQIPF